MIDHHDALIYTMVVMSAADRNMTDAELERIGEVVRYLPVFEDFDEGKLPTVAGDCATILDSDEGLEQVLQVIGGATPEHLRETAYAVACDVAAADGVVQDVEARLLELLRETLRLDTLTAVAIERAARARYTRA